MNADAERVARNVRRLVAAVGVDEALVFLKGKGFNVNQDPFMPPEGGALLDVSADAPRHTQEELDAKTAAALARLESREDPTPPAPQESVTIALDLRLTVEHVQQPSGEQGIRWHVLDPLGNKLNPRHGLMRILLCAADLVARSGNWEQGIYRAAKNVGAAFAELEHRAAQAPAAGRGALRVVPAPEES